MFFLDFLVFLVGSPLSSLSSDSLELSVLSFFLLSSFFSLDSASFCIAISSWISLLMFMFTLSCISFFIAPKDGSISFINLVVTFFSTLARSSLISFMAFLLCSSDWFCFVSRLSTLVVRSSILLLFPFTSDFISEISAIIFFNIFVIGSSTFSTGVFLVLLLNFAFSLFVSLRFLCDLYLLASWLNFDVVSFTLMVPFGEGGFFLFLGLDSSLLGSCSTLLRERLLFSLYFVTSGTSSSLDVEGTWTSSSFILSSISRESREIWLEAGESPGDFEEFC